MTTEELIRMEPTLFSELLLTFDANTCERHARKIVTMLGGPTFDSYLQSMTDIVISNALSGKHDVEPYFQQTENLFPGVLPDTNLYEKLTGLTLLAIALRLENKLK